MTAAGFRAVLTECFGKRALRAYRITQRRDGVVAVATNKTDVGRQTDALNDLRGFLLNQREDFTGDITEPAMDHGRVRVLVSS